MTSRSAKSRRRRRGRQRKLKRKVVQAISRLDFPEIVRRMARSPLSRPYAELLSQLSCSWDNQKELTQKAIELTEAQLRRQGEKFDPGELRQLMERIEVNYDHEMYCQSAVAVSLLMHWLFQQHDERFPFCSEDRRELAHLEELRRYREQGLGVVYLVNHSSHLDEFLLACLLAHLDMGLPLFAAGANMFAIESLGRILRLGSYVVQRRGASRLNLAALFNYCRAISEIGGQQAIFLEAWHGGARSRDGSLRYPRRLVTLRGALDGERDRVVQPVAISYSVVPEDLALAARKSGLCWLHGMGAWRTLGQFLRHPKLGWWYAMRGIYGRAYVTFTKPMLLSELQQRRAEQRSDLSLDEFTALEAIRQIACHKKIMASQLTARALTSARRQGQPDLEETLECEKELIREYHQTTFGQEPDFEDFIRRETPARVLADGLATLKKRKVLARWKRDSRGLPRVKSEAGLSFYATHGDRRIYSPTAQENIVVVGAGDWGFAFTHLVGHRILEDKRYLNASLTLFDPRPEVAARMGVERRPPGRFEEHRLPKNAFVTADPTSAFKKASEVILIASPQTLDQQVQLMLEGSSQPLRVVVATCGFEPQSRRLTCQVVYDLMEQKGRRDVEVYALVGPVSDRDLVEERPAFGFLAGPAGGLERLADLFKTPQVELELGFDPLGAQAAAICARIYALWVNFLLREGRITGSAAVGHFASQAAEESTQLGLALGGKPETFTAACPAWMSIFAAEGLSRHYREVAGKLAAVTRRKQSPAELYRKLHRQMSEQGLNLPSPEDLDTAHHLAHQAGLKLPLLDQAHQTLLASRSGRAG